MAKVQIRTAHDKKHHHHATQSSRYLAIVQLSYSNLSMCYSNCTEVLSVQHTSRNKYYLLILIYSFHGIYVTASTSEARGYQARFSGAECLVSLSCRLCVLSVHDMLGIQRSNIWEPVRLSKAVYYQQQ